MTTRLALRTDALRIADANGSSRWDTTAGSGEVDRRGGSAHAREWRRILNAAPWFRFAKRTPTADSSGQVALSDLSITGERMFRVLLVSFGNTPYEEVAAKDYVLGAANNAAYRCWYRTGDYLVAPDAAGQTATGIWVSHTPTPLHELAADADTVVLPEDYDDVLAHEWAAMLLTKGGAETQAAAELKALAQEMRADLLGDISRISTRPLTFGYGDSAAEWGAM
jgi:hypothetical protein